MCVLGVCLCAFLAGSVSCACCADNQCVTLAGSVQQEQGTGLISILDTAAITAFISSGL